MLRVLCIITVFLVCSTSVNAVDPTNSYDSYYPVGVFEDLNLIDDPERMGEIIDDIQARGMDTIYFTNGWSDQIDYLSEADNRNFNVVMGLMGDLNDYWWTNPDSSLSSAESVIHPLTAQVETHRSVIAYNLIDDATRSLASRMLTAKQAFASGDPLRPALPMIVGHPHLEPVYLQVQPEVMTTYHYPARNFTEPCSTLPKFITDVRESKSFLEGSDVPLWLILQTHSTNQLDPTNPGALRVPTVEEVRAQQWLAIGEGAKGFFWFIYASQQGWIGLEDSTTLMPEVTDLTQRFVPFKNVFIHTTKTADEFTATAPERAYASTLTSTDGTKYVVVVNMSCDEQYVTVDSPSLTGTLQNMETSAQFPIGSTFKLRGGDGRVFKVVSSTARAIPTPTPTNYPNLVANASFESNNGVANFTSWSNNAAHTVTTDSHTGTYAVKITGPQSFNYSNQSLSLSANKTYTMSFYSKIATNVTYDFNSFRYPYTTSAGTVIFSLTRQIGSPNWEQRTRTLHTGSDFTPLRFDLTWQLAAGEEILIDDVSICEGEFNCRGTWPYLSGTAAARPPLGYAIPQTSPFVFTGWTFDPDVPDTSINYELHYQGERTPATLLASGQTSVTSTLHNNTYGAETGAHTVVYNIPANYQFSTGTPVSLWAQDTETGEWSLVAQQTVTGNPPPTSPGFSPFVARCNDLPPNGPPFIFEVSRTGNSTTLHFVPPGDPYNTFEILYGLDPSADDYSVRFEHGHATGALNYTINELFPGVTFYYKVRAVNGCNGGEWSNMVND